MSSPAPASSATTNRTSPPPPPPTTNGTIQAPVASPPPPGGPRPPSGLTTATLITLIVGIVIGGLFVLIGVGVLVIFCRQKKRRDQYGLTNVSGSKDDHSAPLQHWQQNAHQPTNNTDPMLPKHAPLLSIGSKPQLSPVHIPASPPPMGILGTEKPLAPPSPGISLGFSKSAFTYEELAIATDGFSNINLLGQGGFGYVHKGVLPNGREVAIKHLKAGSGQGEREFQAEVEIISRVHHKHLVSLVGYCTTGAQRMLVYEFVPNGTLQHHLHGTGRPTMNWATRIKIALGSAKGLAYLHEDCHPKIIHRDIKAANILLDHNFEAKVADFGLAKFASDTDTHVSTRVMGTFGYLAPEYASSGKLTDKSDVFSFGVVLLELITGRRPIDKTENESIVDWARPLLTQALEESKYGALVDPNLQKDYNYNEMARMVACAAVCVRYLARLRPRMSQVVRALEGNLPLDDLNEGIIPGHSSFHCRYGSSDDDTIHGSEDLKKFRKMALESHEQGSIECTVPISASDPHTSNSSFEGQQTCKEVEMEKHKENIQNSGESS